MRVPVTFQLRVATGSEFSSSSTETYTDVLSTGGTVRLLSGSERINRGLEANQETILLTCPRSPLLDTISNDHRVTYAGNAYEVAYRDTSPERGSSAFICRRLE